MPEAPVHEHCYAFAWKDDVGVALDTRYRPTMNSVAKTSPVELASKSDFRRSVLLPRSLHTPTDGLRGRSRDSLAAQSTHSNGGLFLESYTVRILASTSS